MALYNFYEIAAEWAAEDPRSAEQILDDLLSLFWQGEFESNGEVSTFLRHTNSHAPSGLRVFQGDKKFAAQKRLLQALANKAVSRFDIFQLLHLGDAIPACGIGDRVEMVGFDGVPEQTLFAIEEALNGDDPAVQEQLRRISSLAPMIGKDAAREGVYRCLANAPARSYQQRAEPVLKRIALQPNSLAAWFQRHDVRIPPFFYRMDGVQKAIPLTESPQDDERFRASHKNRGGRPEEKDWNGFIREVIRYCDLNGINRREIHEHMMQWCETNWSPVSPKKKGGAAPNTVRKKLSEILPPDT